MKNFNLKKFINGDGLPQKLSELYVSLLFIIQPLLLHNGFFDTTRTKADCFTYLTLGFLVISCLLLILRREQPEAGLRAVTFCIFVGMLFLSSMLMRNMRSAWIGESNRYQGIFTNLLYAFACLALCRCGRFGRSARTAMLTGFGFVSVLAVMNHLGLDPLQVVSRLRTNDRGRFISTLGNIDIFSAYIVLLLPVAVSLALREKSAPKRAVLWLVSALGLLAAMAGKCESAVLGLGACALFLPLLLGDDIAALRRYPLLFPMGIAVAELYSFAVRACGAKLSELTTALLTPVPALILATVGFALWLALRKKSEAELMRMHRLYSIILIALLVLSAVFLVLANTALGDKLPPELHEYAVLDADWGSDRGKIWKSMAEMFRQSSPLQKLIGGGTGCIESWDKNHRIFFDAVTDTAHNEYLHYLLTNGVVGLAAYLAFLCLSARAALKTAVGRCLLAGCGAYAVQAAVNLAQPITTPLFFVLLFLCGGEEAETESEPAKAPWRILACVLLALAVLTVSALNSSPRPLVDPSTHELQSEDSMTLYTRAATPLYLVPGETVYKELPPHTAVSVNGRTGEWLQISYEGKLLYVRASSLVPASELGLPG